MIHLNKAEQIDVTGCKVTLKKKRKGHPSEGYVIQVVSGMPTLVQTCLGVATIRNYEDEMPHIVVYATDYQIDIILRRCALQNNELFWEPKTCIEEEYDYIKNS